MRLGHRESNIEYLLAKDQKPVTSRVGLCADLLPVTSLPSEAHRAKEGDQRPADCQPKRICDILDQNFTL
jgi:hypothetical protein